MEGGAASNGATSKIDDPTIAAVTAPDVFRNLLLETPRSLIFTSPSVTQLTPPGRRPLKRDCP
jgi:hypothetical protein